MSRLEILIYGQIMPVPNQKTAKIKLISVMSFVAMSKLSCSLAPQCGLIVISRVDALIIRALLMDTVMIISHPLLDGISNQMKVNFQIIIL